MNPYFKCGPIATPSVTRPPPPTNMRILRVQQVLPVDFAFDPVIDENVDQDVQWANVAQTQRFREFPRFVHVSLVTGKNLLMRLRNFNSACWALTPFVFSKYNCISRALEWSSRLYLKDLRIERFLLVFAGFAWSCSLTKFCRSWMPDSSAEIPGNEMRGKRMQMQPWKHSLPTFNGCEFYFEVLVQKCALRVQMADRKEDLDKPNWVVPETIY